MSAYRFSMPGAPPTELRLDCRFYRGDRPCTQGIQGACPSDCKHYAAQGARIVIIKLGALGDVIRTAAILPGVKAVWPESQITWVTRPAGVRMLANHPLIDRLLPLDAETMAHLEYERFDVCFSLDKEPGPAGLAMRINATDRRGVGLSHSGACFPLNAEARPYFLLGLDDDAKFHRNAKTYQELIYEACGLPYARQRYTLHPSPSAQRRAADVWRGLGVAVNDSVIGFNVGAGGVFANKIWPVDRFITLANLLHDDAIKLALFGGPAEADTVRDIRAAAPHTLDTNCNHDEPTFAALIGRCNALLTGDTMAMHAAIAARVPCVVLFGPTCSQEIDLYDRGEKFVTRLACGPCYRRSCDLTPSCMDVMDVKEVASALRRWSRRPVPTPVTDKTLTTLTVSTPTREAAPCASWS